MSISPHAGKCLTTDRKNNWNFIMEECSGKDTQRFVLPPGFPTNTSLVKPYTNDKTCWNVNDDKFLYLGDCNEKDNQNFFYVPESERVLSPSGLCLDDPFSKLACTAAQRHLRGDRKLTHAIVFFGSR